MSMRSSQQEYLNYGQPVPITTPGRGGGYGQDRRIASTQYFPPSSVTYVPDSVNSGYGSPPPSNGLVMRSEPMYASTVYKPEQVSITYDNRDGYGTYGNPISPPYETSRKRSPDTNPSVDYSDSPLTPDSAIDVSGRAYIVPSRSDRSQPLRRPANRDEFDGPHQLLPRPAPEYIAEQERDLPHLPTNLVVHEQDNVLKQVNDRLSRCAFDFVAKYEFPIPRDPKMRPVERPEDREWTEWVYLLKRLATKRRIPARVLYNNQIKQLITVLENSLEMRHASRNQSRPLKDDRNILQLISAGIQVAKILKDASAMDYLDRLYISTESQIKERALSNRYR